ncbi:flagellin [Dyella sp. GSA-30]|uniref:flagellin N-terminal helical domain-containing protein n=1 Tax=Dyella sp. GSA-30 TaxID=2994496 RepID=UPI002493735A|nr:flagellin [Dyella sp. GSA-30]BDU22856.1 flagellin [Dyella sp. GSA-30]
MSLVINTNVSSLTAQNNLSKSQSALATATQRLSSGLKINSAKDNAAGFAISTRFTTQIGGIGQASSNASDAISLAQTTESALDEVTSNLQAIRDLAVQSANGNYTADDRKAIDTEVQQRLSEITRIANQTDFNGTKVLDGSAGTLSFQIGSNVGQTISISLGGGAKTSQLGQVSEVSTGDISGAFKDASGNATSLDLSKISLTGSDGKTVTLSGKANSLQDLSDAINAANVPGTTAAVSGDGKGINVYSTGSITVSDAGAASGTATATGSIFGAATSVNGSSTLTTSGTAVTAAASGSLQGGDVLSVDDSNALISRIDVALSSVSTLTSNLGAIQNRFQSTISTLSAEKDNLTASQSTIQDADFATETANLSKAQILQQAGISVLSQANSQPQQVLKLLQ